MLHQVAHVPVLNEQVVRAHVVAKVARALVGFVLADVRQFAGGLRKVVAHRLPATGARLPSAKRLVLPVLPTPKLKYAVHRKGVRLHRVFGALARKRLRGKPHAHARVEGHSGGALFFRAKPIWVDRHLDVTLNRHHPAVLVFRDGHARVFVGVGRHVASFLVADRVLKARQANRVLKILAIRAVHAKAHVVALVLPLRIAWLFPLFVGPPEEILKRAVAVFYGVEDDPARRAVYVEPKSASIFLFGCHPVEVPPRVSDAIPVPGSLSHRTSPVEHARAGVRPCYKGLRLRCGRVELRLKTFEAHRLAVLFKGGERLSSVFHPCPVAIPAQARVTRAFGGLDVRQPGKLRARHSRPHGKSERLWRVDTRKCRHSRPQQNATGCAPWPSCNAPPSLPMRMCHISESSSSS